MSISSTAPRAVLAAFFSLLLLGAAGCNTMRGLGEDIESGGEGLQHEAEETQEQM